MDLRIITVEELSSFVAEAGFAKYADIPISPLRALSQSKNPKASPDDSALVIAYNNEHEILAYFGCLPDQLLKNSAEKVCWSSCWWVHPSKGKAASMPVFYKALQIWNAKMLFDALPKRSEAVLEKMGYFSFRKIEGIHCFLRFKFHKIIPSRIPILAPLKNIFYVIDTLLNLPVQSRLNFRRQKNKLAKNIKYKQVSTIDQEAEKFIQELSKDEVIRKTADHFNWIIQSPWLSTNKTFTKRYYFSSYANHFENLLYKVYKSEQLIGFLWITLRDGTAKLPYYYVQPGEENTIANFINHQLSLLPIDTFICFQQNLLPYFSKEKTPFLHKKTVSKTFGWTNTLDTYFKDTPYIQDGDGDTVFT